MTWCLREGAWQFLEVDALLGLQALSITNDPPRGFRVGLELGEVVLTPVFSYSEFRLVPGSVSFHLKARRQQGPHVSCQPYALVCAAFLISPCPAGFLLHLLFLPSGSPGLSRCSEVPKLVSWIGLLLPML